jgi:hypothetical protein
LLAELRELYRVYPEPAAPAWLAQALLNQAIFVSQVQKMEPDALLIFATLSVLAVEKLQELRGMYKQSEVWVEITSALGEAGVKLADLGLD